MRFGIPKKLKVHFASYALKRRGSVFYGGLRKSLALMAALTLLIPGAPSALAVDTSREAFVQNFNYNSLISDSDFIAINSMSERDIQAFFDSKNSYLKDHSENGRAASQIVYDAAHGYGDATGTLNNIAINSTTGTVSPKAILVTLQKEQSLITLTGDDRNNNSDQYNNRLNKAMGYACPDGSSCDSRYAGFTKQVENAAWQLRYNYERAQGNGFSDYQVGQTTSISDSTGSYSVTYTNRATASLYRYTPHVFNGNYNFWKLTNEYFGNNAPQPLLPPSSNDTGSVTTKTFKNVYKISSSKEQSSRVFFRGREMAGSDSTRWGIEFEPEIGNKTYTVEFKDGGDNIIGTKQITIDRHKIGDITGDTRADLLDLSLLGEKFGQGVSDGDWTNLNPDVDNEVNILDLSLMAANWDG